MDSNKLEEDNNSNPYIHHICSDLLHSLPLCFVPHLSFAYSDLLL